MFNNRSQIREIPGSGSSTNPPGRKDEFRRRAEASIRPQGRESTPKPWEETFPEEMRTHTQQMDEADWNQQRQQITDGLKQIKSKFLVTLENWCCETSDRYGDDRYGDEAKACRILIDHIRTITHENPIIAANQIIDFLEPRSGIQDTNRQDTIKALLLHIETSIRPSTLKDLRDHAQQEVTQAPSLSHDTGHATPPNPLSHADILHHSLTDLRRQDTNQQPAPQTRIEQLARSWGGLLDNKDIQYVHDLQKRFQGALEDPEETIRYIPIDGGPRARVSKKDLWQLRVTRDITKLRPEQIDEPGIHFIYEKYEIFLSKDAYIHLRKEATHNRLPSQIENVMRYFAPDDINKKNINSRIDYCIKEEIPTLSMGVWDVDIKNISKDSLIQ